jgi:hypothetical protein
MSTSKKIEDEMITFSNEELMQMEKELQELQELPPPPITTTKLMNSDKKKHFTNLYLNRYQNNGDVLKIKSLLIIGIFYNIFNFFFYYLK